ncbi:MAG: 50S ribosomal protein L25 [Pirellulaceae bacterium]|nr:50S ribosomal protein L25 [Pirellulaceae bacterium]MDP7015135.1 50S ribosomal protein L25 [Pirellulaceae bacterium]
MTDVLNVERRESRGSRNARRDRRAGRVPAVLYGHGEENVSLSISADEFSAAVRHGSRLVNLAGAVDETAFIKVVQWDAFGIDVLHVDFARVTEGEMLEVTVTLELRGEAPGSKVGGVVEHQMHQLRLSCPLSSVTDKISVNINTLELDGVITTNDLELPEGALIVGVEDAVVVQCVEATEEEEDDAVAAPGEPEVIGRSPEEEEEG